MEIKVIKTQQEYESALAEIESLIELDPDGNTPEANRLELLGVLVEKYESEMFPIGLPDPIQALEFRMKQLGLSPRDLEPYIGNRSRVSEVLSGKRSLTVSMIRALHKGLGIPPAVLLQERNPDDVNQDIQWDRFPLREMCKRGYFQATAADMRTKGEEIVRGFFAPLGTEFTYQIYPKQGKYIRCARQTNQFALTAWAARVVIRARRNPPVDKFTRGKLTIGVMRELAQLSRFENGPALAGEFLSRLGISLVVERHLAHTYLDGAAIMTEPAEPVIGLTLRYDRLDNFWFTLEHELAHIMRHMEGETREFFDDLDVDSQGNKEEKEADETAGEALIPEAAWRNSPASGLRSPEAAQDLAQELDIHPAIVAGRIQRQFNSYRVLRELVGQGEVRKHFPDIQWE